MNEKNFLLCMALVILSGATIVHTDIYFRVDIDGISHFTNSTPPESVGFITLHKETPYNSVADLARMEAEAKRLGEFLEYEETHDAEKDNPGNRIAAEEVVAGSYDIDIAMIPEERSEEVIYESDCVVPRRYHRKQRQTRRNHVLPYGCYL